MRSTNSMTSLWKDSHTLVWQTFVPACRLCGFNKWTFLHHECLRLRVVEHQHCFLPASCNQFGISSLTSVISSQFLWGNCAYFSPYAWKWLCEKIPVGQWFQMHWKSSTTVKYALSHLFLAWLETLWGVRTASTWMNILLCRPVIGSWWTVCNWVILSVHFFFNRSTLSNEQSRSWHSARFLRLHSSYAV